MLERDQFSDILSPVCSSNVTAQVAFIFCLTSPVLTGDHYYYRHLSRNQTNVQSLLKEGSVLDTQPSDAHKYWLEKKHHWLLSSDYPEFLWASLITVSLQQNSSHSFYCPIYSFCFGQKKTIAGFSYLCITYMCYYWHIIRSVNQWRGALFRLHTSLENQFEKAAP